MTETSWPLPPDRIITDLEYERLMASPLATSGLVGRTTDPALVYADSTGRHVKVHSDRRAWVRGFEWDSGPSDNTLTIAANSTGATRRDLVVLRLDRATFAVNAAVVTGTATVPSPTQNTGTSGVWELPLASVAVANGAVSIAPSDVTPLAWYLGANPVICTAATSPPFTTPGLVKFQDGLPYMATGSGWLLLMDSTRVPLGNAWSKRITPGSVSMGGNLGDGTRTWLSAQNIAVQPSRTYRLFAQVSIKPSLGEGGDQSARLNLYQNGSAGTLLASSGRVRLNFMNNGTYLHAVHPHYRTSPSQTTIPLFAGTLILYGASGYFNIDSDFDVVVEDVGPVDPA